MPEKKKKQQYHHGDLKRACIRAALKIIREKGEQSLSLREVAKKLGVSHGAPYKHFASKEELIEEIVSEGFRLFLEYLIRWRSVENQKAEVSCRIMGHAYLDFSLDHPDFYGMMFAYKHHSAPDNTQNEEQARETFKELVTMVQVMQEKELFISEDPLKISVFIWTSLHGFCSLLQNDKLDFLKIDKVSAHKSLDEILDKMFFALKPISK
ncbi:TetR/AcrR family transcriptional regulator [Leptospira langatensis]|uniref:TetR/AcrR family transcriptional regulator n=1 Tax=Leptospira langatensis TaxID=2484983 RepID=A0A5F1ZQE1_9LEPT|nr:TetR/AcrR family transcriptional regulator [Leptospira langatensis]TGK05190.1 TetR/AcrR family transcriptional regulator [Leptospira langatensis]TGL38326.1 TetR/AcrR family transcriptional regulator [Leptospira langatensis]